MIIPKKKKRFSVLKAAHDLSAEIPALPDDNVYKFISDGGFSSCAFIKFVADRAVIHNLHASSFRIGKKELQIIDMLFKSGRIKQCFFAVGTLMANDSDKAKKYAYYSNFRDVCNSNGWEYATVNNHSKLILFDTDQGKFVLETSSNLNENPKIEQFSFEKSASLFEFYRSAFDRWMRDDDG